MERITESHVPSDTETLEFVDRSGYWGVYIKGGAVRIRGGHTDRGGLDADRARDLAALLIRKADELDPPKTPAHEQSVAMLEGSLNALPACPSIEATHVHIVNQTFVTQGGPCE